MKTTKLTTRIARWMSVVFLALLVPGCLDIETTTEVRPDGSLVRTVVISGDSAEVASSLGAIGIDGLWSVQRKGPEEKKWTIIATRTFPSVEGMALAIGGVRGRTLQVTPRLEKHFRWFFTRFRYSETWGKFSLIDAVPMSEYLSKEEIEAISRLADGKNREESRGDSLAHAEIGERFMEWDMRNRFEAYFREFLKGVKQLGDPTLSTALVEAKKEQLFQETFKKSGFRSGDVTGFSQKFQEILGTSAVERAFAANPSGIESIRQLLEFEANIDKPTYTLNVSLPGIITKTNAESVEGNRVSWKEFKDRLAFDDYTMWAESSVVNWWAIVISAILLVFIVVMTVLGMIRARKMRMQAQV